MKIWKTLKAAMASAIKAAATRNTASVHLTEGSVILESGTVIWNTIV